MASRRPSPVARVSSSAPVSEASYSSHNPSSDQVTALLLDVLRNVNREVKTTLVLDGKAHDAVVNYQAIAADLRTLADGPVASSGGTTPVLQQSR
jgi:ABC-type methionine transport system ATPase subunit